MYGSTIASDLVCLAGLVSELNAVPGSLDNLPSGRPGKAPEMGGETSYGKSIENTEFFKENGGLDASDYISIHSRKHMYDPDTVSTPKKLNMERMLMLENCVKILL